MSFYGNITNVTKTNFAFDRIYANRVEMETHMAEDEVYIGRFVLVDYDANNEFVKEAYYDKDEYIITEVGDVFYYLFSDPELNFKIAFNSEGIILDQNNLITGMNKNDLCYIENVVELNNGQNITTRTYYQCYGGDENGNALFAKFNDGEVPENGSDRWNYAVNYNIDQNYYGKKLGGSIGRGWDSTVWQKMYENGKEIYAMVAELNGVVPTFTLSADAPTMNPITPHFDEVSNNTYYELHWQPQWGMRVKHAKSILSADKKQNKDSQNNLLSDETTTWIQSVYNKDLKLHQYYYYGLDGKWHLVDIPRELNDNESGLEPIDFADVVDFVSKKEDSQIPAAIYYNKDGFNPKVHFSSSVDDKVQMTPTGYSQKPVQYEYYSYETETGASGGVRVSEWETTEYNDHERGNKSPQVDTQEWQMILPSLGNAVSSMWDIVYGIGADRDGNPVYRYDEDGEIMLDKAGRPLGVLDNDYNRLTFIDWVDADFPDNTNRLRLVDEQGNDGFSYNSKEVETLAGCINSIHDLMGMIIVDNTRTDAPTVDITDEEAMYKFADQASGDNIYYLSDGGYYRKGIGYKYEPIDCVYELVIVTEDEYQPNFYYYKDGEEFIPDIDATFDTNKIYYVKKINNPDEEYTLVENLDSYEKGKYYYAAGDNFLLENNHVARNVTYYLFGGDDKLQKEYPTLDFIQNKYYEKTENGSYQPASTATPTKDMYYTLPTTKNLVTHVLGNPALYDEVNETYLGKVLTYLWTPGAFGIQIGIDERGEPIYDLTQMDDEYDPAQTYYLLDWQRKVIPGIGENKYEAVVNKAYRVNLLPFEDNQYFTPIGIQGQNGFTYVPATKESIAKEYEDLGRARLENPTNYGDSYTPRFDKQYYYELNGIEEFPLSMFYVTNKFYYRMDNNFFKDKNLKLTPQRQYYTLLKDTFVKIDSIFYKPNTYYYKDGVYYYLDKSFNKQDIDYYRKNYFYINSDLEGLYSIGSQWNRGVEIIPCTIELAKRTPIPEMQLLNGFARSFNTIHGLIIEINKLLLSGDYHTRDRNTVQGCINLMNDLINRFQNDFAPRQLIISDNYGRIQSVPIETNQWIDTDIIGDVAEGKVRIEHMYPNKQENTTGTIDKNGNGDTIELEKIIIDETGHVKNTHTDIVTLPYGYKTFIADEGNSIADNTQDTLNINGDDWIKTSAKNDYINLIHLYPNKENNTSDTFDINNNGDTINLETIFIDETGHIKNVNTQIVTLPYGYKTFIADQGSSEADNTQDTIAITGDNWIQTNAENDKISLSHVGPVETAIIQESNQTPNFGSTFVIKDLYFDEKGHKANESSHTITIPQGSLVDATTNNADLIIQLAFEPETGKLSTTRKNVGELLLNGYSKQESGVLTQNDTINQGFGKLEGKLDKEITDRTQAIKDAIEALDITGENNIPAYQTIYTWSETDGKINISTRDISIPSSAINDKDQNDDSVTTKSAVAQAIDSALNKLDYSITNNENQIIRNISQENGKISVTLGTLTKQDISDLEELGTMAVKNADDYLTSEIISNKYVSIDVYNAKIIELEETIDELKDLINSYHENNG